jgi:hypothetical protein
VEVKKRDLCSELIKRIVESNLPEDEKLKLVEGIEYRFLVMEGNAVRKPVKKLKFLILNVVYRFLRVFNFPAKRGTM